MAEGATGSGKKIRNLSRERCGFGMDIQRSMSHKAHKTQTLLGFVFLSE